MTSSQGGAAAETLHPHINPLPNPPPDCLEYMGTYELCFTCVCLTGGSSVHAGDSGSVFISAHINRSSVTVESYSFSLTHSSAAFAFFLRDPHPPATSSANLLMKGVCDGASCRGSEALYYPNSKGLWRPPLRCGDRIVRGGCFGGLGAGGGTKSTALPNELKWPIETGFFSFF